MAAHGAHTCLVSGGFTLFTGPIAAAIGFAENRGNRLDVDNGGRFTGARSAADPWPRAKLATLLELRAALGLEKSETLVVGDGANDLLMIRTEGSASPITRSPSSPPRPARGSIMATSPRCSTRTVTSAR